VIPVFFWMMKKENLAMEGYGISPKTEWKTENSVRICMRP